MLVLPKILRDGPSFGRGQHPGDDLAAFRMRAFSRSSPDATLTRPGTEKREGVGFGEGLGPLSLPERAHDTGQGLSLSFMRR
jgi:hypothetical protein